MTRALTPLTRPGKIICVGLNYRDHARETGIAIPEQPLLFGKWPTSIIGPGEPIVIPPCSTQVDYEAELGLVIGRRARDLRPDEALGHVAGVVCVNDVSARDLQFADGQWTRSKSFDSFCPVGPAVVPLSAVGALGNLRVRCLVNGSVVQESSTSEMVFDAAQIVAYASRSTTLEPGDLIATGTPAGVGFGRTPPLFLRAGDVVTVEIERIGELTNPVIGSPVGAVEAGVGHGR